jgi:hypothetical protein
MPYFKPFPVADESALKRFGGRAQTVVRRCTRTLKFSELEYSCGIKFLGADVLSLPILSFEEIGTKKIMGL